MFTCTVPKLGVSIAAAVYPRPVPRTLPRKSMKTTGSGSWVPTPKHQSLALSAPSNQDQSLKITEKSLVDLDLMELISWPENKLQVALQLSGFRCLLQQGTRGGITGCQDRPLKREPSCHHNSRHLNWPQNPRYGGSVSWQLPANSDDLRRLGWHPHCWWLSTRMYAIFD